MSYGLPYDSDEGRALAGAITAIMTGHAYEQSAEIAGVMGAFKGYHDARCAHVTKPLGEDNVESMLGVIQQHRDAVEDIQPSAGIQLPEGRGAPMLGRRPRTRPRQPATATPRSPSWRPPAPSPS